MTFRYQLYEWTKPGSKGHSGEIVADIVTETVLSRGMFVRLSKDDRPSESFESRTIHQAGWWRVISDGETALSRNYVTAITKFWVMRQSGIPYTPTPEGEHRRLVGWENTKPHFQPIESD